LADQAGPFRAALGLGMVADASWRDFHDGPDTLLVAGGPDVTPLVGNSKLLAWLRTMANRTRRIGSICTGTAILIAAGPAKGRRVTTHWSAIEDLRAQNQAIVLEGARYVPDGQLVTSAGVSAGIDMALWVVGQLRGPEHAREVQRLLEYYPEPPYPIKP
jgi:transcriptional regulator GlxA family with amidase domain